MRTRVGYTGGDKVRIRPTTPWGDHTEAIRDRLSIPRSSSYADLLAGLLERAQPTAARVPSGATQYKAASSSPTTTDQRRIAQETARPARARSSARTITTRRSLSLETFYRAEDYHQKYRLRFRKDWTAQLIEQFGSERAFVDSTAAARLNGLLDGYGDANAVKAELRDLGVDAAPFVE